jgi:hypothetical protein
LWRVLRPRPQQIGELTKPGTAPGWLDGES